MGQILAVHAANHNTLGTRWRVPCQMLKQLMDPSVFRSCLLKSNSCTSSQSPSTGGVIELRHSERYSGTRDRDLLIFCIRPFHAAKGGRRIYDIRDTIMIFTLIEPCESWSFTS